MNLPLFEEDRALAGRLAAGEDTAFERFFGEYFPRLYRFALARANGDEALVEDVVQESLSTAIRQIHGYRGEAALFSWLCTICRRNLARKQRSNRRVQDHLAYVDDDRDLRSALDSIAADLPGADRQLITEELRRTVHGALDTLPERYARSLEWKYLEDLGVKDIAMRLGVSAKAAESLLTRARGAFKDVFQTLRSGRSDAPWSIS